MVVRFLDGGGGEEGDEGVGLTAKGYEEEEEFFLFPFRE